MAGSTLYGDISPNTAGHVVRELLERGMPYLCFEKFGQSKALPARSTKSMIFTRYLALDSTPSSLSEGVTKKTSQMRKIDLNVELQQYGDGVTISDVVNDTHLHPVMQEAIEVLGEQAAIMVEKVRYNVVKAGTSVFYANGVTRAAVNQKITTSLQRRITRFLKRGFAQKITRAIASTTAFGSVSVAPSFICIHSSDISSDVSDMYGFKAREDYGSMSAYESEIGKVEDVRYIESQIVEPFADAGGAAGSSVLSTSGANADVYPMLFIAKNSYGIVALKGKFAVTPMVVEPKPSDSDPWAQRGHATWKTMQSALILNDDWLVRAEVAATA